MHDREKVIEWADKCTSHAHESEDCNGCPYHLNHEGFYSCIECLLMDTVAMLKEQEAVKPRVSSVEQRCGNCNKVIEMDGWITCPWCGKPIDWEGWWKKNGTRNQDT